MKNGMKWVLLSIRPRHFKKIAVGLKGVEARKVWPKVEPPFGCLIYCTKDEALSYSDYCGFEIADPTQDFVANGKVVAEFVCNQICAVLAHPAVFAGKPMFFQYAIDAACLTQEEVEQYGGGKDVAGLVISDLQVYDKPKELSEFSYENGKPVLRPPQNWCYVKEANQGGLPRAVLPPSQ